MFRYLIIFIFLFLNDSIFGFSLHYTCTTSEEEEWLVRWEFSEIENSLKMIRNDYTGERIFISNSSGSIQEFFYKDIDDKIYFSGKRNGTDIEVSSSMRRRAKSKNIDPENAYWYQPLGLCFFDFALSGDSEREFFFVNPESLRLLNMTIEKEGTEFIEIDGESREAIYAELRLNGILAPFWRGRYWLCPETGIILRYIGTFGPGTEKTVMEITDVIGDIENIAFFRK